MSLSWLLNSLSDEDPDDDHVERATATDSLSPTLPPINEDLIEPDEPTTASVSLDLDGIKFPRKTKKRGRPAGAATNAIGLPCSKRQRSAPTRNTRTRPFQNKSIIEKQKFMLGWFVDEEAVKKATSGNKIAEEEITCIPTDLPSAMKDDAVDINVIRRFFNTESWTCLEAAYNSRVALPYQCPLCKNEVEEHSVMCDSCLEWYHYKCEGLRKLSTTKFWYCRYCTKCKI